MKSELGDIYDHFGDCLFIGFMFLILMNKVDDLVFLSVPVGYVSSMSCVVINYDKRLSFLAEAIGSGGNEDGYTLVSALFFPVCLWIRSLLVENLIL